MPRKLITYIVFFTFLKLIGCYSYQELTYQDFESTNPDDISSEDIYIITRDSSKYHSSLWNFSEYEDSVFIKGSKYIGEQQAPFKGKIAVSDIHTIEVDKYDGGKTVLAISIGIVVGIAVIVFLASESVGGCSDNVIDDINN